MVPRGGMQLVRDFKALQSEGLKRKRPLNLASRVLVLDADLLP
ncbi:hypothetical protein SAMN02990966_07917 [Rhodospirillales bacterium URHD0017]|nr:hypothetical protein SAMN02990966_07917 [Rhodospirillales bacterium URHD0017]